MNAEEIKLSKAAIARVRQAAADADQAVDAHASRHAELSGIDSPDCRALVAKYDAAATDAMARLADAGRGCQPASPVETNPVKAADKFRGLTQPVRRVM
jgi:hypothetical protein